jgi:hypothetical protein
MKLTTYSKNRITKTAEMWRVERDYFQPLYNYLVYGWEPGSFWCAVLENDWFGAIARSHPGNSVEGLKNASKWITGVWPAEIYGDLRRVRAWTYRTAEERRTTLEQAKLIYTEQQEVEMALKGVPNHELELY